MSAARNQCTGFRTDLEGGVYEKQFNFEKPRLSKDKRKTHSNGPGSPLFLWPWVA
jgi:hypothetical protein